MCFYPVLETCYDAAEHEKVFYFISVCSVMSYNCTMFLKLDRNSSNVVLINLGQTNLISGSMDFFQNLKGQSVGKKRKIKKIPNFLHWL